MSIRAKRHKDERDDTTIEKLGEILGKVSFVVVSVMVVVTFFLIPVLFAYCLFLLVTLAPIKTLMRFVIMLLVCLLLNYIMNAR